MTLEEAAMFYTIRRTHQRARTALDMPDHPLAHGRVVLRQLELADRAGVAGVGPQALARRRDAHAHD